MTFFVGGFVITCAVLPGMAQLVKLFQPRDTNERRRLMQSFRQLQKSGYVTRKIKNGKEAFVVTQKGKQKIAQYVVDDCHIARQTKWDKKWRMVMFDIPEKKARVRKEVSFRIKSMGMHPIQNSVFVSPFPCKKEIDFLMDLYGVRKYFVYTEANTIECSKDLLGVFNLR